MGGEHPFLINLGGQRNDRDDRGMLICTVIAHDDRRTDTALLTGVYVLTEIYEINISTLTHPNPPRLTQHIRHDFVIMTLIHFFQFHDSLCPVVAD